MIVPILLQGAISGAIFTLLALGFTLIYGVSGIVNLAHGSFFMLGAYTYFVFISFIPLGTVATLLLAAIFVGILGGIVYRLAVHPVIDDEISVLVVTVGLALVFQQFMLIFERFMPLLGFGPPPATVPTLLKGSIRILGTPERYSRLLALAISLTLFVCLSVFIAKLKIGRAMRAVSQDREAAMLMGINTERLYMLTMAISASFAAIAGVFIASSTTGAATPFMWLHPLALSFSIVILGGLGSIKGTIIGGFIIGYAQNTVALLSPQAGTIVPAVPFVIMVLILFLKPKGLFGKRIEMEE